mgnify:CR=1 FL=1
MKKFNNFLMKFGSTFAAFAFIIGMSTSNAACRLFFYQNEVPEELKK